MGIFDFLKKKEKNLPMPPPPSPPDVQPVLRGDIEPIRAPDEMPDLAPLEMHEERLPELPPALPAPEWKKEVSEAVETVAGEREVKVFDKTIKEEAPEIKEVVRVAPKPSFVAIEDYKRIINDTNTVRSKLMDAENFVRRLSDLKNEEERAFDKWRKQLEDVEKKLNYVDELIVKAQG